MKIPLILSGCITIAIGFVSTQACKKHDPNAGQDTLALNSKRINDYLRGKSYVAYPYVTVQPPLATTVQLTIDSCQMGLAIKFVGQDSVLVDFSGTHYCSMRNTSIKKQAYILPGGAGEFQGGTDSITLNDSGNSINLSSAIKYRLISYTDTLVLQYSSGAYNYIKKYVRQ